MTALEQDGESDSAKAPSSKTVSTSSSLTNSQWRETQLNPNGKVIEEHDCERWLDSARHDSLDAPEELATKSRTGKFERARTRADPSTHMATMTR